MIFNFIYTSTSLSIIHINNISAAVAMTKNKKKV